jgi:hypothetical protein
MMADEPDNDDVSEESGDDDPTISDEEAEERTLVATEAVLGILATWAEDGLPIMFLSAVEEEDEGAERSLFTEIRGCHVAIKEQNAVLAKGVQILGRIADALEKSNA